MCTTARDVWSVGGKVVVTFVFVCRGVCCPIQVHSTADAKWPSQVCLILHTV